MLAKFIQTSKLKYIYFYLTTLIFMKIIRLLDLYTHK